MVNLIGGIVVRALTLGGIVGGATIVAGEIQKAWETRRLPWERNNGESAKVSAAAQKVTAEVLQALADNPEAVRKAVKDAMEKAGEDVAEPAKVD